MPILPLRQFPQCQIENRRTAAARRGGWTQFDGAAVPQDRAAWTLCLRSQQSFRLAYSRGSHFHLRRETLLLLLFLTELPAVITQAHAGLLLTVLLHLAQQDVLLRCVELVAEILL